MLGLLEKTRQEVTLGHVEVRQVFRVPRIGNVAGCFVTNGTIRRTSARVLRDNVVVHEGRIESLMAMFSEKRHRAGPQPEEIGVRGSG